MNQAQQKVATEVAEAEFDRFLEAMDLAAKCDAKGLDPDDLKSFAETQRVVIEAIEQGHLVIDEDGCPVYTPKAGGSPLRFHEPTMEDLIVMDQVKKGRDVEKQAKLLAQLTSVDGPVIRKLKQRDIRVLNALLVLFLA